MMDQSRQRHLDGDLAELIIYPANISDHDRQRVEVYLARKWGFSRLCLALCPHLLMRLKIHMFPQLVEIQSPPVFHLSTMVEKMRMLAVFYGTVDAGLRHRATSGGIWLVQQHWVDNLLQILWFDC